MLIGLKQRMPLTRRALLTNKEVDLVNVFHLLGDKTRFKIFKLLMSNKELCVTEIADKVGISAPAVSQHFRIFELTGLVDKHRYGQKICYVLKRNDGLVQDLITLIKTNR